MDTTSRRSTGDESERRPDGPDGSAPGTPGPWRGGLGAALGAAAGFAVLWGVLAALRPTVTFHLAPAVVAGAYTFLRRSSSTGAAWRQAALDALIGAALAVAVVLLLSAVGWLRGPVLFGGGPVGEGVILAAVGALAGAVIAPARRGRQRTAP